MPKFKKMQKVGREFVQVGHIIEFNQSNADTLNAQTANCGIKYVLIEDKPEATPREIAEGKVQIATDKEAKAKDVFLTAEKKHEDATKVVSQKKEALAAATTDATKAKALTAIGKAETALGKVKTKMDQADKNHETAIEVLDAAEEALEELGE